MATSKIAIVDYGMGNLHSVRRALAAAAPEAEISLASTEAEIRAADRIVLPGQGAMADCMASLEETGIREAVLSAAQSKPLLGVCVGFQMLFTHSEEGDTSALGIVDGEILKFRGSNFANEYGGTLKVPHMGWSRVEHNDHDLWQGVPTGSYFYFVHSYYAKPADDSITTGRTRYGAEFCCAIALDNIFAVQFHPEKSAEQGLQLYKNFVEWKI